MRALRLYQARLAWAGSFRHAGHAGSPVTIPDIGDCGFFVFEGLQGSRCLLAGQELVPMCEEGYRGPGILGANLGVENPSRKFRNLEGESRRGKEGGRIDGDAARLRNPRL